MRATDPLIDGATGARSVATHSMERQIVELVQRSYPRFEVRPFSAAAVRPDRDPHVEDQHDSLHPAGHIAPCPTGFETCARAARIKIIIQMTFIGGITHSQRLAGIDETSAKTMTWMAGAGSAGARPARRFQHKMIIPKG